METVSPAGTESSLLRFAPLPRSTGLRLNLGQGGQVPGTKHRVFLGW